MDLHNYKVLVSALTAHLGSINTLMIIEVHLANDEAIYGYFGTDQRRM